MKELEPIIEFRFFLREPRQVLLQLRFFRRMPHQHNVRRVNIRLSQVHLKITHLRSFSVFLDTSSPAHPLTIGRWLQRFQRMTMSEGTGPSSDERHSADANGDHRFSYDEEPKRRQKHEDAAHDDDCRLGRETFRRWYRGAHRSLHRKTGRYSSIVALTSVLGFVRPCQRIARWGQAGRACYATASGQSGWLRAEPLGPWGTTLPGIASRH